MTFSDRQFGLLPEAGDQLRAALHGLYPAGGVAADLVDRGRAQVGQHPLLGSAEDVLGRVQLGRMGRQPLKLDLPGERLNVFVHAPAAMRRQPVPDDQQLAADRALRHPQELDDLRSTRVGYSLSPDSSTKTTVHPSRRAILLAPSSDWSSTAGSPASRAAWPAPGRCEEEPISRSSVHTCDRLKAWPNASSIRSALRTTHRSHDVHRSESVVRHLQKDQKFALTKT